MFTSVRGRPTAARLALGFGLLLASAACGGGGGGGTTPTDPDPTPPSQSTQPVTNAAVSMRSQAADGYYTESHSFSPSQVKLKVGGTVTWNNATGVSHNVTFAPVDGAPADVANSTSGSVTRTFGTVGTFGYQCTNHEGMSGTITVVQ